MRFKWSLLFAFLLSRCAPLVCGQNPTADGVVDWTFEDGTLEGWRCKTNTRMSIDRDAERGNVLKGTISYGEFSFGWFTRFCEDMDFTGIWALELDVHADGGGGRLDMQLGRRWPERSIYYRDEVDAVELDFTGWRRVRFLLPNFLGPVGRDRLEDLARIFFVELFVDGRRKTGGTDILFDNVRAVPATAEQRERLLNMRAEAAKLSGPPAADGSNLLPNPGFEQDFAGDGLPDFWTPGDWGLGSEMSYDTELSQEGSRSVAVTCAESAQRGSWQVRVPLTPGSWRFSGWYATEGLTAEPRQGVDARITIVDDKGKTLTAFHAYGGDGADREWRQAETRFEAPRGTSAAVVYLFNYFAKGKVWWDSVVLCADLEARAEAERRRKENEEMLKRAATLIEPARQAVERLAGRRSEGNDWALLHTTLDWALEDVQLALDAGLGTSACTTLKDVLDACERAEELMAAAGKAVHPARQGPDLDANPYYANLNPQAAKLAAQTATYKKGEDGYLQVENAWTFRTLGEQCAVMAWALLHPRSELYHDPRLLKRLLVHFQAITQNHENGDFNPRREAVYGRDMNINRFCIAPMMDAYLMLEAEYPWVILPSKREEWREQLRVLVEYQYETYGPREPLDPERPRYYPNMDVHHLLIMEWAYRIFGAEKYARDRDTILEWLDAALYPMGAWTYHWPQNECYVYHQLNVTFIARYYDVTGDARALELLRRSMPYYPSVHDAEGMTESYTDCSWKHYWTGASPAGADLIAGMFNDPGNKRAALDAARNGYGSGVGAVYTGPWWKDMKPAERRDDLIFFDENVQGPRGWSGAFSFAGTARVTNPGEIGKDTFVGCMISDRNRKGSPLDAALQIATIEYRLKPEGPHWHNARYCSGHERFSVIVTPEFATLCVRYRLTRPAWGHGSSDEPWEGVQQWFMSHDRLLGLLTIRALEDHECVGIWGRLRFGLGSEIETGENGMFKYGSLIAKLHEHSFAHVETAPSETFFLDKPEKYRSRELLLKDAQAVSGAKLPYRYKKGDSFHFMAEVLPYWSELATDVSRIPAGTVMGFAFGSSGKSYQLLHNQGDEEAQYIGTASGASAKAYRSPGEVTPLPLAGGAFEIRIPAQSHVLVEVAP